jgi:fatty acid desaturase
VNITVNEWVGRFCGLVLILPFEWFRYFHLAHHKYTNIPGKDPELEAGAKPDTWRDYIWHVSGIPYWVGTLRGLVTICRGGALGDYVPQSARPRIIREARMLAVIYALIFLSLLVSPIAFYLWILPIIVGQPFLRLYLLAEHGRCPFVADMFQNTRTTFTNRIVRFLAWNMPYHAEHHTMPTVPFHNLPDLHVETQAYLAQTENGYATFHRSYIGTF